MTPFGVFTERGARRKPLQDAERYERTTTTEQLTSDAASSVREEM